LKDGKEVNAVMLLGRLFHARVTVTCAWMIGLVVVICPAFIQASFHSCTVCFCCSSLWCSTAESDMMVVGHWMCVTWQTDQQLASIASVRVLYVSTVNNNTSHSTAEYSSHLCVYYHTHTHTHPMMAGNNHRLLWACFVQNTVTVSLTW